MLYHRLVRNYVVIKCLVKYSVDKALYFWYSRSLTSPFIEHSELIAVLHQLKSSIMENIFLKILTTYHRHKMKRLFIRVFDINVLKYIGILFVCFFFFVVINN